MNSAAECGPTPFDFEVGPRWVHALRWVHMAIGADFARVDVMHTAHPIDTLVASSYSLVGRPWLVCAGVFVQRSAARGRPWLRVSAHAYHVDPGRVDWYMSAYPTRKAAIAGSMGGVEDRGQAFDFGGANVWG